MAGLKVAVDAIHHSIGYAGKADTSPGVLPPFDTGLVPVTFNTGVGAALRVTNGKLTFAPTATGNAAGYMSGNAGAPIRSLTASWTITPRTTASETMCIAMSSAHVTALTPPFPNFSIHLVIGRGWWELKSITGGSGITFTQLGIGTLPTALVADGTTVHTCTVAVDGSTATITLPGGSVQTFTHPHIAAYHGPGFWVEPFCDQGNTDGIVGFTNVTVDAGSGGFADGTPRIWNGSAFVAPSEAYVWQGGQFVKVWPSFVRQRINMSGSFTPPSSNTQTLVTGWTPDATYPAVIVSNQLEVAVGGPASVTFGAKSGTGTGLRHVYLRHNNTQIATFAIGSGASESATWTGTLADGDLLTMWVKRSTVSVGVSAGYIDVNPT